MKNNIYLLYLILTVVIFTVNIKAQTVVTPISSTPVYIGYSSTGSTSCQSSSLTIILEGKSDADQSKAEWLAGSNISYRIKLPNGFKFISGPGDIIVTDNLTSPDDCQIGLHYENSSGTEFEFVYSLQAPSSGSENVKITIQGLVIACTKLGSYGDITRIAGIHGTDGSMAGNNVSDNVSHGFLDSRIGGTISGTIQKYNYYYGWWDGKYHYSNTSNLTTLKSSDPAYTYCADTSYRYYFQFATGPSGPTISTYKLYENNSYTNVSSTSPNLTFNPDDNQTNLFQYTIRGEDNNGCQYKLMDSIDIQHNALPPPATFVDSDPSQDIVHDTVFAKDSDPTQLKGYMTYSNPTNSVTSYYSNDPGVDNLGSGSYLFSPSEAPVKAITIYYTATNGTCTANYAMPHRFTVYDPSQAPASWLQITSGNKVPFCQSQGDLSFKVVAPTGFVLYEVYFYYVRFQGDKNHTELDYYPSYSSESKTFTVNTEIIEEYNQGNLLIQAWFYNTTDLTYQYQTTNISIFPKRNLKILGLPKPTSGSSAINDSTVVLCGSTKDTLYLRFLPENGFLNFYKVDNTGKETLMSQALGLQYQNDPYFRKVVPYQVFNEVANGDTSIHFLIKYKYPGSKYSDSQCPDSIQRRIKFNSPIDVVDTIVSPSQVPYCVNDDIQINIKYPSNINYSSHDKFIWNYGDGTGDYIDSNLTKEHTFVRPGKYILRFKTNLYSLPTGTCNNDLIDTLKIGAKPIADFDIYQNFLNEQANIISNARIDIPNLSTPVSDPDTIYNWYWDLGDGTQQSLNLNSLSHTYNSINRDPYKIVHIVQSGWGCSDTITKYTPVFRIKSPDDNNSYYEDFNDLTSANSWYASGWYKRDTLKSSWENNIANGNKIKADTNQASWNTSGYSIDNSSAKNNSYKVTYANNEISWVESPVFDLSNLTLPMISFNSWVNTDNSFDGACVQYTICDSVAFGKEKWNTIGQYNQGLGWYNSFTVVTKPGGSLEGWTGDTSSTWEFSAFRLNQVKDSLKKHSGAKYIRFRIVFASNGDNYLNKNFDGFSFDNFFIGERNRRVIVEEFCDYQDTHYIPNIDSYFLDPQALRIQYHTSTFTSGDSINRQNPADPSARALYYGIGNALPRGVIDGILEDNSSPFLSWGEDAFFKRSLMVAPFNLSVSHTATDKLSISATIHKVGSMAPKNYVLQIAVIEREVTGNGITFTNVLRSMVPNAAGTRIDKSYDWSTDKTVTVEWNPFRAPESDYRVIAFLQDEDTKEIYQSGFDSIQMSEASMLSVLKTGMKGTGGSVSINDAKLSPNPTSGDLKVSFNGITSDSYTLTIIDGMGKPMKSQMISSGTGGTIINTDELSPGMYYLKIDGEGQTIIKKFSLVK